jgi:hypothetical protein
MGSQHPAKANKENELPAGLPPSERFGCMALAAPQHFHSPRRKPDVRAENRPSCARSAESGLRRSWTLDVSNTLGSPGSAGEAVEV